MPIKKTIVLILFIISVSVFSFSVNAEQVISKNIIINFPFGERTGTYTGNLENGIPEGNGKFESVNTNGEKWYYEGEFQNGIFMGNGKIVWDNGSKQEGTYSNGEITYGKQYLYDKLIYEGNWANGEFNGEGKSYENDKLVYEGNWANSYFNGDGKFYKDGTLYFEGTFEDGKAWTGTLYKNGKGHPVTNGDISQTGSDFSTIFSVILVMLFIVAILIITIVGCYFVLKKFSPQSNVNNTKSRESLTTNANEVKQTPENSIISCPGCGANNIIVPGKVCRCEYCNTILSK